MKHLYIITALLLLNCIQALADDDRVRNDGSLEIVYGVEWGGIFDCYSNIYALYTTEDGYLVEYQPHGFVHHLNGYLDAYAGIAIPSTEITAHIGYQGLNKHYQTLPVSLKVSYFMDKERLKGIYVYGKGSLGIPIEKINSLSYSLSAGIGYRIDLNGKNSLNYTVTIIGSSYKPVDFEDPYSGQVVTFESIRKSHGLIYGLAFGIGLNF